MIGDGAPSFPRGRLTLQEYAAVSARLHRAPGVHPAVVLAQLGIQEDAWRAAAAEWERLIDEELVRGSNALLTTFAARFVATRAAIGRRATPPPPPAEPAPLTRREPALSRPSFAEVPNLPIGPGTAAVESRHRFRPAVPFVAIDAFAPKDDGAASRAVAGTGLPFARHTQDAPPPSSRQQSTPPPPSPLGPSTLRVDAGSLSLPPEPPVAPAIPLVRLKRVTSGLTKRADSVVLIGHVRGTYT